MGEQRFGLDSATLKKIRQVLSAHEEIDKAILYGSRAKGNFRVGSDIDLTLVGEMLTYRALLAISNELDDLLLPYTFDLSLYHELDNPELIDHIERIGQPMYERTETTQ